MRVPPCVIADPRSCSSEYLVLEFWRGTDCVGICQLPISKIRPAATSQVMFQAHLAL